jgi:uncharacterized iron-regulated protein
MYNSKSRESTRFILLLFILCGSILSAMSAAAMDSMAAQSQCVAPGTWLRMQDKHVLDNAQVFNYLSQQEVVLLGERHDNPDHHRWQLQVIAGLFAFRQDLAIGFEMFPREVQPVLDKWVAGELSESEFLKQSDWYGNWSFDPDLYLPIFNFARINHISMIALNVNRSLFNEVRQQGWALIPHDQRQGITDPATPQRAYLEMLAKSFVQHHPGPQGHDEKPINEFSADEKKGFQRFVEGQQLWDRAMAQGIAGAAQRDNAPLVVGVMGSGHMMDGFGVPHQLSALGIRKMATLVPWDDQLSCEDLVPEFAYAVFGLQAPIAAAEEEKPHLGVYLEPADNGKGMRVVKVVEHSIAEASGIAVGDHIVELAGMPVHAMSDVVVAVQNMVPGSWLPLTVERDDKRIDIIAKFPATAH